MAALNYARHVYGPDLANQYGGIGSGHGYANGAPINEPVIGFGTRTGERYTVGERGREWVIPESGAGSENGQPGGVTIVNNIQLPEGTSVAKVADSLPEPA